MRNNIPPAKEIDTEWSKSNPEKQDVYREKQAYMKEGGTGTLTMPNPCDPIGLEQGFRQENLAQDNMTGKMFIYRTCQKLTRHPYALGA